mmetsp:Transcript_13543/g.33239  ORF Transcript_13543/g.33239 Transcript_13543/m.33239 type:complete len:162 (-) Transcript_13543:415-900(-)
MSTPPLKVASPSMSALHASMSKWLDGSSSSRMCGLVHVILARATRFFCPPLSWYIGFSASSCGRPKDPRCPRSRSSFTSGYARCMEARGVSARSMPSTWCWLNTASRTLGLRVMWPWVGCRWPLIRPSSVDLPIPLGPTMAARDSRSRPKFRFLNRVGPPG